MPELPVLREVMVSYTFSHYSHNERNGVSNHRRLDCLLNRLCRCRSKKTLKLRITGVCEGNPPVTDGFPSQRTSNAENISISWPHYASIRHHFSKWQCDCAEACGTSIVYNPSLIARFMGPTWGPSVADRTQVGPMLARWTLLSGFVCVQRNIICEPGPVLTKKTPFYWYRHSHYKPGTVLRPSYVYNGDFYAPKSASF